MEPGQFAHSVRGLVEDERYVSGFQLTRRLVAGDIQNGLGAAGHKAKGRSQKKG
jgi:hypothetical protein